jgi:4-hydroxybenzoate polyprenyltransferase
MLVGYACTTVAYSLWLKRVAFVDVLVLAGLYALRLVAGGVATQIVLSECLLAFSGFLFASLALAKRYSELLRLRAEGSSQALGRGYTTDDIRLVETFGVGCGLVSTVVFALYITSPQSRLLYAHPTWLWAVCPLLMYWNMRLWLVARQGRLQEDPLIFAMSDSVSRWLGVAVVGLVVAATGSTPITNAM